jgi:hypothetical protein
MAKTARQVRGYQIGAICFTVAGLLWCVAALIGGNAGLNIPIGMMNVCIGMMFLAMSHRQARGQNGTRTTNQSGPQEGGEAEPNVEADRGP